MPNKSSKAGHVPMRTCLVCRKKTIKANLLRFVEIEGEMIFDFNKKIQTRGSYVCEQNKCLKKLFKRWKKKKR